MSLGSSSGNYPFWKAEGPGLFVHSPLVLLIAVIHALLWAAEAASCLRSSLSPAYFPCAPKGRDLGTGQGQGWTLGDMDSTPVATLVLR